MFNIVQKFGEKNHLKINDQKSAFAWSHDDREEPIMVQPQNKPITMIGNKTSYRYLGWLINLKLDWRKMYENISASYKGIIHTILRKKYLGTNTQITLINNVAAPILEYCMTAIPLDQKFVNELDTWTVKQLQNMSGISKYAGKEMWWLYRGLKNLNHLNIAIATHHNIHTYDQVNIRPIMRKYTESLNLRLTPVNMTIVTPTKMDPVDTLSLPGCQMIVEKLLDWGSLKTIQQITQFARTKIIEDAVEFAIPLSMRAINVPPTKANLQWEKFKNVIKHPRWYVQLQPYIPHRQLTEDQFFTNNEEIWIWTDGSIRIDGTMISATWSGNDKESTTVIEVHGTTDSTNPELAAILTALEIVPPDCSVKIFTDSLNAKNLINKFTEMPKKTENMPLHYNSTTNPKKTCVSTRKFHFCRNHPCLFSPFGYAIQNPIHGTPF